MTTWLFVALIWYEGGPSWPDTIWSFAYHEQERCRQKAQQAALEWSQKEKVRHVIVSECFRFVHVRNKEA